MAGVPMLLIGCASVTVKNIEQHEGPQDPRNTRGPQPPAAFVVQNFAVDLSHVKENRWRRHPGKLAEESQRLLAGFLAKELGKTGIAVITDANLSPVAAPPNAWVISGTITRVAEGNRLLRMGIGLGTGGTKMETNVSVNAVSDVSASAKPAASMRVLQFSTTGGSNATPGAATMPIPFSGLPTALMNSKDGVTADAARTARMITATITDYLVRRGWLKGTWEKPKLARS